MGNNQANNSIKIVFLDVDGVLNSLNYTPVQDVKCVDDLYVIEEEKIKLLKEIIIKTNAKIVISSTWRNNENTKRE